MMERYPASQRGPDVSLDERTRDETLKRIRKLRWIGREHEAQQLQAALSAGSNVHNFRLMMSRNPPLVSDV